MTDNNSNQSDEYGQLLNKAGSQATAGCGIWILGAVGLVLALAGLGHLAATVLKLTANDGHWWLHIGPGLLFLVAAGMLLHLARQLSKAPSTSGDEAEADTFDKLRARQQASGQVTGAASMLMLVQKWASVLAMVVLALILTVAISTELADSSAARWIMAIAVIIALSFAQYATREARLARERGSSRLTIDKPPVRLGEQLSGHISINLGPEPEEIRLELFCERVWITRTHRHSDDHGSSEHRQTTVLYETANTIMPSEIKAEDSDRWRIPVEFEIPPDARPTDRSNRDKYVFWRLKLSAHCADGDTRQDGWEVLVVKQESDDGSA